MGARSRPYARFTWHNGGRLRYIAPRIRRELAIGCGMALEVSAVQAAQLAHVSEQTVRAWIQSGRLAARKVQRAGKPAAWAIDVDALAGLEGVRVDPDRLRALEMGEARTAESLEHRLGELERYLMRAVARITALERRLDASPDELSAKSDSLTAPAAYSDTLAELAPESRPTHAPTAVLIASSARPVSSILAGGDLPPGSARLQTFCDAHGLSSSTVKRLADKRTIPAIIRPDPQRGDGYRQIWFTPEHQAAALEECRRRGLLRG